MAFFTYRRIASPDRVRNTISSHHKNERGQWACRDCGEVLPDSYTGDRRVRPALRCDPCRREHWLALDILSGRYLGQLSVNTMRKNGELPDVRGLICADCDRPAECWDHRDYNEPRRVEAVCLSCNVIRGHALPFNPYLVGLMLIEYVRQTAHSSIERALPAVSL